MEIGRPGGTASLGALADGNVSLYTSGGGGMLGASVYQAVRSAGLRLCEVANVARSGLVPVADYPLPAPGHVRFYLLSRAGVLSGDALEEALGSLDHPLGALFSAGQEVIGQLMLRTPPR
jgi:hypothetical protein